MKNGSKNKFLLSCFRPQVVDIDTMLEPRASSVNRSSSRRFSCIPVSEAKQDAKILDQENWAVPQYPPKQKLAKVIKTVLFETILNKSTQYKNRFGQDCFGSKSSYSEYSESSSNGGDEKSKLRLKSAETNIKEIKGRELSLLCSSSSSPASSESNDLSKYDSSKGQSSSSEMFKCVGIFLVLMSLAVTVVWGKWKAIFLTSMWLCFFSLLLSVYRRLKEVITLWNTQSNANARIGNHNGRRNY